MVGISDMSCIWRRLATCQSHCHCHLLPIFLPSYWQPTDTNERICLHVRRNL